MESECDMSEDKPAVARALDLQPHPEGGWYRRTWTAPVSVMTDGGPRATASAIEFYLAPGELARWHVVRSDELWLWHGPGVLDVQFGGSGAQPDETGEVVRMGLGGPTSVVQCLIPAGVWQRTFAGDEGALATCVVSPEFSFDDWKLHS